MIATTLRVLFVDDDLAQSETLAKLIRKKIAPAPIEIFFADSLEKGMRMAHELIPCIVFLDLIFPGTTDWRESAGSIPKFKKEGGAVVIITEMDTAEVEMECRKLGALSVFGKSMIQRVIEILVHVITNIRLNSLAREGLNNGR